MTAAMLARDSSRRRTDRLVGFFVFFLFLGFLLPFLGGWWFWCLVGVVAWRGVSLIGGFLPGGFSISSGTGLSTPPFPFGS